MGDLGKGLPTIVAASAVGRGWRGLRDHDAHRLRTLAIIPLLHFEFHFIGLIELLEAAPLNGAEMREDVRLAGRFDESKILLCPIEIIFNYEVITSASP